MKTWREMLSRYDTTHIGLDAMRELVGEVIIKLASEERPSGEWVDARESVELLADRDERITKLRRALAQEKVTRAMRMSRASKRDETPFDVKVAEEIARLERDGL